MRSSGARQGRHHGSWRGLPGRRPRSDLEVTVDGVEIEPGLALGTWVAFKETDDGAMLMGDLVLAEDEVNPVMERLLDGGVHVTALHKHLIGTEPSPMYMHIGAEGDPVEMAQTIRAALELTGTPLGGRFRRR